MTEAAPARFDVEGLRSCRAAAEQAWNEAALTTLPGVRLAFWTYDDPAIVLGAGQRPSLETAAAARRHRVDLIGRRTGGTAVFAGAWMLSTSFLLPPSHPAAQRGPASAFELVADAHVEALGELGVRCGRAETVDASLTASTPTVDWACFGSVSRKEVVTSDGRKLVGLAQARRRTGVLIVAGVLLHDPDWELFCSAMAAGAGDAQLLRRRSTSCAAALGATPDTSTLAAAIERRLLVRVDADV